MNDNSGHTVSGLVWRNYNYLAWKSYNLVCGCDECETDDRSRFENFIDSRNCSELYVDDSFLEDCSVEEIFMLHDILKDMNISYYAYMDSNLA